MTGERRVACWASAALGVVALGAVGAIVWMAAVRNRSLRPAPMLATPSRERLLKMKGLRAERDGDLPGAEARYREALALDPKSGTVRLALGRLRLAQGDRRGAWPFFRALPPFGGEDVLAWVADLGGEFGAVDPESALKEIVPRDGATGDRHLAWAHFAASRVLSSADARAAVAHLRRAVALDAGLVPARLALVERLASDRKVALSMLDQARARTMPAQANLWARVARAYDRFGGPEQALAMARSAGAKGGPAWCALGESALSRQDRATARLRFDAARRLARSGDAELWCRLARDYLVVGEPSSASAAVDAAQRTLLPGQAGLCLGLATVMAALGRDTESRRTVERSRPYADERQRDWIRARLAMPDGRHGPSWPVPGDEAYLADF